MVHGVHSVTPEGFDAAVYHASKLIILVCLISFVMSAVVTVLCRTQLQVVQSSSTNVHGKVDVNMLLQQS